MDWVGRGVRYLLFREWVLNLRCQLFYSAFLLYRKKFSGDFRLIFIRFLENLNKFRYNCETGCKTIIFGKNPKYLIEEVGTIDGGDARNHGRRF